MVSANHTWPIRLADAARVMRTRAVSTRSVARAALCCWLGVTGCAAENAAREPEPVVRKFANALAYAQLDEAYNMMSPDFRKRVDLETFRRQLNENPQEVTDTANALAHSQTHVEQSASVHYGDDGELRLQKIGERWFISSDVATFYDQSSPRAALRTFVHAMERKRYDVVMRVIPNADKESMTPDRMEAAWSGQAREEVERMLVALRANLDTPIEEVGDHATMAYGDHKRVQFVREDGLWKIEDPQ